MISQICCISPWRELSRLFAVLAAAIVFCGPAYGQNAPTVRVGGVAITGIPDDWTHHHLVFSNPGTEQQAVASGRYEQWRNAVSDSRYVLQQLKKKLTVQGPAAADAAYRGRWISEASGRAEDLPPDAPGSFGHVPIGVNRGPRFVKLGRKGLDPSSDIKKDWNESLGTGTAPTPLAYPAAWSTSGGSTASCTSDFVIFPTGQAGSSSHASLVAYYNLYAGGCSGTVPQVDWAYNTGGTVSLAPTLALSGNQLAFIQTSGTTASLVLLTFPLTPPGTGTLTAPVTPTAVSAANYRNGGAGCASVPCSYTVALSGNPNDTWSSPYYDYGTDSLYVGDSTGKLHKFHPVFQGVPGEVTSSNWPVQLTNTATDTNQVASPVYDPGSGYVFVGTTTSASTTTGGRLYAVNATSGAIHAYSAQLDNQYGIRDAAIIDPYAQKAYVFAGHNPSGNDAVYQFATSFTTGSTPASVSLGSGGTGSNAYQLAGTLDNAYYTSSNSSNPSGNLYVCSTGAAATLYQVAITNGALSASATTGPTISSGSYYGRCSPITEFYNANIQTAGTPATGSVTISSDPSEWSPLPTLTIGSTTYRFVSGAPTAVNQVEIHTGNRFFDTIDTAQNLNAVINANSSQCSDTGCVFTGQAANSKVTSANTFFSATVNLTAISSGAGGDFALNTSNSSDASVTGGNNGVNGTTVAEDLLFLSVYDGVITGCTNSGSDGCVMSFNITTPSSFGTSLAPLGELDVSAPNLGAATGGIVVDNSATNLAGGGESQIYFVTQTSAGTAPCAGVCGVQASQINP